jgi:DHA3 family tetracycline resistance protein-like MFS transporter
MRSRGASVKRIGMADRLPMLRPLRHRDFRLLWTGMTVSLLGDGIFLVALAWQVYVLSNAPTALAVVGLAISLPHLAFLLVGGMVSDRVDRRRVMVLADALRGTAIAAIGVLSVAGSLRLWHLLVLAGAYGAGSAFFGPAFDAIVPELVPVDALAEANSLDQFVRPAALRLIGPALGGWVIAAVGTGSAFLLDAGTFLISIVALLLMRRPTAEARGEDPAPPLSEIVEGFRYVRGQVWLWGTFLAAALAYLLFMGPVEVLLPYVVKNDLHRGAGVLGFVFAMGGLGAISGAIAMGHRGWPRRHITFMYTSWTLATLAVAGYGLARFPWQVMLASFAFYALEAVGTIVWSTTKHRLVPSRLLGRVSSLDWFISIGLLPVSFALTGPVASALGARATLVWSGILGAGVTLGGLFLPGMRNGERDGTPDRELQVDVTTTSPTPGNRQAVLDLVVQR